MAFLDVRDVSLTYGAGGTLALQGCSLEVGEGEFHALVGPSGCGKSSLLKVVSGLHPVSTGEAWLEGERIQGPQRSVGMAFQNPTLLPWRSALDNVLLPMEIVQPHRGRLRAHRAEYEARVRALLAMVGLDGFEQRHPWELSGGMQQRVSLCRALIHEPELLLLDEPFAALDAFTREELWCVLRDLWQAKGFTVILVTHDLREATFLADRVHVMSARPGRIVATREIPFARPRELEICYVPAFVDLVHELRSHIAGVRAA